MDKNLFNQVVELTGLPAHFIKPRLEALLEKKGIEPSAMTMEDLRIVLVDFLQDVILEARETAREHGLVN